MATLNGCRVVTGTDDRGEECVYLNATVTDDEGREFHGPILCMSNWRLWSKARDNYIALALEDRLEVAQGIADMINKEL